jgi:hypothetical protein
MHQKSRKGSGSYSSVKMPEPDGHPTFHKPRRNYWGNLYEEDTYKEEYNHTTPSYDYSDFDSEDDNSSYYDSNGYD